MRRTMIAVLLPAGLVGYCAIVLAGEPGSVETGATPAGSASVGASAPGVPPAQSGTPAAPAASASAAPMDPKLLAELQAAAGVDEATVKRQNAGAVGAPEGGAAAAPAAELGKGVVGNETNPAIAFIVDAAGAWFSQADRIHQGGHSPHETGPMLQSAELSIEAPVDPFFKVVGAFQLAHGELEEGYAVTTSLPLNLQIRAGKFKAQVGRHNPTHLHTWKFATTPLPNEFVFGGEGLSAPGAEVSVLMPLPWYVELVGAFQAAGEAGSFRFRTEGSGEPTYRDFTYPVRLVQFFDLSDDWALQVGANTVQGRSSMGQRGADRTQAYGGDLFLKWRPIGQGSTGYVYVATTVEGWYRKMAVEGGAWRDAGGYADVTVGLDKEWDTGIRADLWRRLDRDNAGIAIEDRIPYGIDAARGTVQLSFMPSHFSRVRAQYAFEKTELFADNHIALLQLEVAAGAHGAHTY